MNLAYTRIAIAVSLLAGVSMAIAQEPKTFGELLDKGAKRLDAAELKALMTGATSKGTTFGGQLDMETTFAPDGSAKGRFWGGHPEMPPHYSGTWNINEPGQLCIDMLADPRGIGRFKACGPWYALDGVYYIPQSGERSAVVRKRTVTR